MEARRFMLGGNRTWPASRQWLIFGLQALLVSLVEAGNDIFRGNIRPPNAGEAVKNAHRVVDFEAAHGFFVEPAWQIFFHHTQHILGMTWTWALTVHFANSVYAYCHIFVTLLVTAWVFARHRHRFPLVRNLVLFTNLAAAITYELYPMAPPRLTSGLIFDHHPFRSVDTMRHIIGDGKLNGVPIGYNAFSAMPSVHVAWAIIIGLTLVFLARHPLIKALGAIYPGVMLFTVIVTGNHYVMDGIGAILAVGVAAVPALAIEYVRRRTAAPAPRGESG